MKLCGRNFLRNRFVKFCGMGVYFLIVRVGKGNGKCFFIFWELYGFG